MPGCGMDIVPTDCLAAYLHEQLPSADHLELVFGAIPADESEGRAGFRRSSFSRGTAQHVRIRTSRLRYSFNA